MQREFWKRLEEEKATSLAGVPYTFEMLDRLRFERKQLPHLKTLTQAGGKLRPELVQKFASLCDKKQMRFFVMYGQTEASPRISYLPPELALQKPNCIGLPIQGGQWWVEDAEGNRLPSGKEGELVYQGANVMMGYAECQEDLASPDQMGGILRTGDIAILDKTGMATITGRTKRMIKIFGNRIGLDDLEHQLSKQDVRVYCLGKENQLEVIYESTAKNKSTPLEIGKLLGVHPSAIRVHQVQHIPHKNSGKVDYPQLALEIAK
jgi:acyl-coenzyme A synthetase/AMP-(fatty) acid ligase